MRARWRVAGQPSRRGTVATFWATVWCGKRPDLLDDVADAAAQLGDVARRRCRAPSMRIRPHVGSMSRLTILSVVVLPQPEGPTRTQMRPAGTVSVRSSTAPCAVAARAGGAA